MTYVIKSTHVSIITNCRRVVNYLVFIIVMSSTVATSIITVTYLHIANYRQVRIGN